MTVVGVPYMLVINGCLELINVDFVRAVVVTLELSQPKNHTISRL